MSATVNDYGVATLQFFPGLGYSVGSGIPFGGLGVSATPLEYSSTYFGSDVKGLLPGNLTFGRRRRSFRKKRRSNKKNLKSKKRHG